MGQAKKGLLVVVICTPSSTRAGPLLSQLRNRPEIDLHELSATMVRPEDVSPDPASDFDPSFAHKVYARPLLAGELGCSFSNNVARTIIGQTETGGLVFEDDARIVDLEALLSIAQKFLSLNRGRNAVLSFFSGNNEYSRRFLLDSGRYPFHRVLHSPAFTVGYALTPGAANSLVKINTPVKFVADWPPAKVRFYICDRKLVLHGDEKNLSTIVSNRIQIENRRLKPLTRLSILFGTYWIKNRSPNFQFKHFFQYVWVDRFRWYLNRIFMFVFFKTNESL